MISGNLLYSLSCVLVPMAWGLVMVLVVGWFERALERRHARQHPGERKLVANEGNFASPEYHI